MTTGRRGGGAAATIVVLTALVAASRCGVEHGALAAPPPAERLRARPPERWPPLVQSTFFDDAFATLEGQRPDFAALGGRSAATAEQPAGGNPTAGDGFRWSALVSAETLADEVKDQKGIVQEAIGSATTFKGGGYERARVAFSSIALVYGVIAAYDGDIRWKKEAAAARDLFGRVGFNCKVGTDQSFAEAKARGADLGTLLEGNGLASRPDRDPDAGDPPWSQIAARPALMNRLAQVDAVAAAATGSRTVFKEQLAQLVHEVEIAAVIAEAIQRPDYEYHDDDTYRGYAAAMRAAAEAARAAAGRDDYDGFRTAVGSLKKSCDTCHGDYRS
ncbi:MAG: cytochrome c [Planctomycetes bacterium]|nr:cytochrome c [Planctomycetota bacterium]